MCVCVQDPQSALAKFEQIRQAHPTSAAVQFGLAKALDKLADLNRSNQILRRAIDEYEKYIEWGVKLNDTQFKVAAERCIERMRFIGNVFHENSFKVSFFSFVRSNWYC